MRQRSLVPALRRTIHAPSGAALEAGHARKQPPSSEALPFAILRPPARGGHRPGRRAPLVRFHERHAHQCQPHLAGPVRDDDPGGIVAVAPARLQPLPQDSPLPGQAARAIPVARRTETPGFVLDHADDTQAAAAVRLLLFTGARSSEITGLRWEWIRGTRTVLPDSKTGPKTIQLPPPARVVLESLARDSAHVFPHPTGSGPMRDLKYRWSKLRVLAGLEDVRVHDLRHSCASSPYLLAA